MNEVHARTTRRATIRATADWWTTRTGDGSAFGANDPLFVARYSSGVGAPRPPAAGRSASRGVA